MPEKRFVSKVVGRSIAIASICGALIGAGALWGAACTDNSGNGNFGVRPHGGDAAAVDGAARDGARGGAAGADASGAGGAGGAAGSGSGGAGGTSGSGGAGATGAGGAHDASTAG